MSKVGNLLCRVHAIAYLAPGLAIHGSIYLLPCEIQISDHRYGIVCNVRKKSFRSKNHSVPGSPEKSKSQQSRNVGTLSDGRNSKNSHHLTFRCLSRYMSN